MALLFLRLPLTEMDWPERHKVAECGGSFYEAEMNMPENAEKVRTCIGPKGCGKKHERIYVIRRQPVDQLGHFMCFMVNGESRAWDASLPQPVEYLPKGPWRAVEITGDLASSIWHCQCGSHCFGCCYLEEVDKLAPKPFHRRPF